MTNPKTSRTGFLPAAGLALALTGILLISATGPALSQPGQAPQEVTAPPVTQTAPPLPPINAVTVTPTREAADAKPPSLIDLLAILLPIIIGTTALVTAVVNVFVAPWTMRRIAADQRVVADKAANAAVSNAAAASENAKAAGKSAEAAVLNAAAASRNSVNTGIHQVARLRQEWINDLRNELAALHSLLSNFQAPAATAALDAAAAATLQEAHDTRVRDANTRLARVEMLLNPRELESRRLVSVLRFLESRQMTLQVRHRRARWIVRWGQIVLKTEWDRVRSELNGTAVERPKRRERSLKVLSTAPFGKRVKGSASVTPPPTAARKSPASKGGKSPGPA